MFQRFQPCVFVIVIRNRINTEARFKSFKTFNRCAPIKTLFGNGPFQTFQLFQWFHRFNTDFRSNGSTNSPLAEICRSTRTHFRTSLYERVLFLPSFCRLMRHI
jgi:hypothetical protein